MTTFNYNSELIKAMKEKIPSGVYLEKPRDFDPFGHAGFAHLWLQYD